MVVIVERSNEQMQVTKTNKHLSHSVRFVCDYFLFKIQPKLSERIKLLICVQHIPSFCLRSLFSLSVKYRNQFASHLLIDYKMIVGACTMHSSLTNLHHTHTHTHTADELNSHLSPVQFAYSYCQFFRLQNSYFHLCKWNHCAQSKLVEIVTLNRKRAFAEVPCSWI